MACGRGSTRERYPKISQLMDGCEDEVLAHMTFPKAHRQQIHSTNPLERLSAEVKRRTEVVGIFPNDAAIVRLIDAMLLEQSGEWNLQKRYIQLEGFQAVSDYPKAKLSAIIDWGIRLNSQEHGSYATSWDTIMIWGVVC